MSATFDELEVRSAEVREAQLLKALPLQIAHAQSRSAAFAVILAGVDAAGVTSREALAQLPVTRKYDLQERQAAARHGVGVGGAVGGAGPDGNRDLFGGFSTLGLGAGMPRVFCSPGPIYEPEARRGDYWRVARALFASGFRAGDLVHNSFSYHFMPAGFMMEGGAHALGCTVFAAGTGQTEQQVQAIEQLCPAGYVGTPSFLKIILDKAAEMGVALPSLRKAMVGGEAFPPSLRDWLTAQGVDAYQCYATADLGLIAYETSAREGLVTDEGILIEIVRPGTGTLVQAGEVGELVVTTFNPDYPLIRYGTGDLTAILPGHCPTGRSNTRIKGWLGRADQTTKVRGLFVHPAQVQAIASRFAADVTRVRLVVSGDMAMDVMTLQVETPWAETESVNASLKDKIAESIRDVTKLRGNVALVPVGSLPNDGKVIEDARSYR